MEENTYLNAFINGCSRGEILSNRICLVCAIGYFSIFEYGGKSNINSSNFPDRCAPCPINADCLGRDIILASEGYFRLNSNTSLFVPCIVESACPSQILLSKEKPDSNIIKLDNSTRFYHQYCKQM